ncbi:MAG: U32 family peptidase [Planctomycetota bacterium]|nr:U32 family peptidase [Planctomycetota bacterium]
MTNPAPTSSRPELLAPAGDWEAMKAAVANGADAVYFGLGDFNARHRATNFTLEELPTVVAYLHGHNVRGYVTFNTLIFSDELPRAAETLRAIAQAGVDAVIVQDLGLVGLIRRLAPGLAVHGSTQMTLTEPRGVRLVRDMGVARVVLARELSAPEVGRIASETGLPVEVFVHGALCVAYSGQCLTSESLGGRSANRGQCAQACRLPYDLIVDGQLRPLGDKAYLLSPQDLAAHDLVDDLIGRGVHSLKIEGRLKSAHYVAATTQAYRAALDAAIAHTPFSLPAQQRQDLQQSFSRGFGQGFLGGANHQTLVPGRFPKSRGLRVGTVVGHTERGLVIELGNEAAPALKSPKPHMPAPTPVPASLKPGDGVVFDEGHPEQDEQGGRVFEVRPIGAGFAQRPGTGQPIRIEVAFGHGDVNLAAVAEGSIVWKTDDPALRRRLEQSFARDTVVKRAPLHFEAVAPLGGLLLVRARDEQGNTGEASWEKPLEKALKHPLSATVLREQFARLGETPFALASVALRASADGPSVEAVEAMTPKSVLNDLRRVAVERLLASRSHPATANPGEADALERLRTEAASIAASTASSATTPTLYVLARTDEQLDAVLAWTPTDGLPRPAMVYCDFEDVRRYKDAVARARAAGMPVAVATLRIIKPAEEGLLQHIADSGPDAVLVRNLAGLSFFREQMPAMPLIADYSLNIANELTAAAMAQRGVVRMAPSYDLSWTQMRAMFGKFDPAWFEAVVHQHMPMFHMEHCVFAATLSNGKDFHDCGRPCESHKVSLRDRVGQEHPLVADVGCRNTVFNAQAQSAAEYVPRMREMGLRHFRVELLRENAGDTHLVLDRYARVLAGIEDIREVRRSLRVLSQLGVTAGTLDRE